MVKKINILVLSLLILLSVGAVSATDDINSTLDSDNAILEVSDDVELSSNSHTVTQKNYNQYFVSDGLADSVKAGDTIYLDGSLSDLKLTVNKKVNIVGTSTNNMKKSMITLTSDASGSTVSNLNIANEKDETYGIFLNSASNCVIKDCVIKNKGKASYAICLANGANYNNVTDNDLTCYGVTYGHGTRSTPALILSGSHYNYIANNKVMVDDANGIYLSSYAGGPLKGGESNFNTLFNNTVMCNPAILPTSWSYNIQVMGNNNTIQANKVLRGYRGISAAGVGNIIVDNIISNVTGADYNHLGVETGGEYAIVGSYHSLVKNNTVKDSKIIATGAAISVIDDSIVEDNWANITFKGRGITAAGSNVVIKDNTVFTELGSGIYEKDEGSGLLVKGNKITSVSGVGILIEKLSSKRMPKNVTITENTITTGNNVAIDASGVQEDTSDIDLKSNAVFEKEIILPSGKIDTSKPTYIYNKGDTYTITPTNIRDYINDNGGLTSTVKDGDILSFEGTFNNEIIYVTKSVKITGKNPIFYNSTFKVTSGNVFIENLTILNNEAERVNAWGIFVNQAPGVRIMNNKITVSDPKAAYAVYVLQSTDIDVWNNELTSQGEYLTFTLLSYACEDCSFVNNTIHTIGTGEAYSFEVEKCIDGNELVINGRSYCLDGGEVVIDGKTYCLDGNELVIDGKTYCLDGNELVIDGTTYCIDGNELTIDGKSYTCIDGNELTIDGKTYCLDGNELTIDGKTYCIDGSELTIDGTTYCVDGNEYCMDGAHVVQEIYRTYGILLLYSSNNLISGNDVNVTSNLDKQYSTTGNNSSTNSIVGIDLYYNSHNNVFKENNVFVTGNDNYIYGMGVLGYYTGHNAPEGQGATNNTFEDNTIELVGPYFATGLIVGDESEGTVLKNNIVNLKTSGVTYGITLEMSQASTISNNTFNLDSQEIYGIDAVSSSDNAIDSNNLQLTGKQVYGILISNGKNNNVTENVVNAKGNGQALTIRNLDSLGIGNAGLYLKDNSTGNIVKDNEITSNKNYAILVDDVAINNVIQNNYLDSEKGIANKAINNSKGNSVANNYKFVASAKADSITVPYVGKAELKVVFDKSIDGAIVKFYDVDNNNFANSTVSNGIASANYQFDKYDYPAQYIFHTTLLKEDYKTSNFDIKVIVSKGNIDLDLNDLFVIQKKDATFVSKVIDELGNPIKGVTVQFNRISSVGRLTPMGSAVSDENGTVEFKYDTSQLDTGEYSIVAEVTGVENYNDANATANLKVAQKALISGNKNYAVYYGNTVKYKVRIFDLNGNAVGAGKVVTFKINGKTKTVNTDKNGYATYSAKLSAGKYTISAEYEGHKVSNTITFKPTVIAKNLSKKKAKTIKYTVKVLNKNGKILKNKKVTFKVKNKKYTAKTNKKGIATLTLKNLKVGKYAVSSTYGGCTVKTTLTIKK
ncbi:MAG: right-handed parallel beta-helix repeat-containing protein [Methanobrevibacter sp.]|nr:right-handed parallel beta-helix repeat-containing protein [Methanobrevibacter sp.]